jgi:hypothetical protein
MFILLRKELKRESKYKAYIKGADKLTIELIHMRKYKNIRQCHQMLDSSDNSHLKYNNIHKPMFGIYLY